MSDNKFSAQRYAATLELFCSLPIPADPFSLLAPVEEDIYGDDETDETLDDLDEIISLEGCDDILFELIDRDINGFPPEPCAPVVSPMVENVTNRTHAKPSELSQTTSMFASSTANKQPLRMVPLSITGGPPTSLPEWLVKAEAFDDPTHRLCSIKVQDCNAKPIELLYMHVGEKLDDSKNRTIMQANTKTTVDAVGKPKNENTIPKVPPHVVKPELKEQTAMKSREESSQNTPKETGVTLINEKLRNHFHKLSTINVPVLGSAIRSDANGAESSRRKQSLCLYKDVTEAVKPKVIVSTALPVRVPAPATITLKNNRNIGVENLALSNVATRSTSSSGTNIPQSIGRSSGRILQNSKQKTNDNVLLNKTRRSYGKTRRN